MSAGLPQSRMICHCGQTALYRVGDKGYCSQHRTEAVARIEKFGNPRRVKRTAKRSTVVLKHVDKPSRTELLIRRRESLFANPTPSEAILRSLLPPSWVFQPILYGYIPDFLHRKGKLIVEVDGSPHFTKQGIRRDALRTARLEKRGYKVIRFTNNQVCSHTDEVISKIMEELNGRVPR